MYNPDYFSVSLPHGGPLPYSLNMYNCSVDLSQNFNDIIVDGFFNQVNIDAPGTLLINDLITINACDGYGNYIVQEVTPNVTLTPR